MPILKAENVEAVLKKGGSARADAEVPAKFKAGDAVRSRNINPTGHTRLPRYARDKLGRIEVDYGVFIFADSTPTAWARNRSISTVCALGRRSFGAPRPRRAMQSIWISGTTTWIPLSRHGSVSRPRSASGFSPRHRRPGLPGALAGPGLRDDPKAA